MKGGHVTSSLSFGYAVRRVARRQLRYVSSYRIGDGGVEGCQESKMATLLHLHPHGLLLVGTALGFRSQIYRGEEITCITDPRREPALRLEEVEGKGVLCVSSGLRPRCSLLFPHYYVHPLPLRLLTTVSTHILSIFSRTCLRPSLPSPQ